MSKPLKIIAGILLTLPLGIKAWPSRAAMRSYAPKVTGALTLATAASMYRTMYRDWKTAGTLLPVISRRTYLQSWAVLGGLYVTKKLSEPIDQKALAQQTNKLPTGPQNIIKDYLNLPDAWTEPHEVGAIVLQKNQDKKSPVVLCLASDAKGSNIFLGCQDGTVRRMTSRKELSWHLEEKPWIKFQSGKVTKLQITTDGSILVAASDTGEIKIVEKIKEKTWRIHTVDRTKFYYLNDLSMNAQGTVIAAAGYTVDDKYEVCILTKSENNSFIDGNLNTIECAPFTLQVLLAVNRKGDSIRCSGIVQPCEKFSFSLARQQDGSWKKEITHPQPDVDLSELMESEGHFSRRKGIRLFINKQFPDNHPSEIELMHRSDLIDFNHLRRLKLDFNLYPGNDLSNIPITKVRDRTKGLLNENGNTVVAANYTAIRGIAVEHTTVAMIAGSPTQPYSIVTYDLNSHKTHVIKRNTALVVHEEYIPQPRTLEFATTNNEVAHAFYYPPTHAKYCGTPGEKPPLIVISHGGPTGHEAPVFHQEIIYWTSRGFAVVDVNYGGSTGYGRQYRDKLKGNWGIVDVDDCTNAALYCAEQGLADRNRLLIQGGSAGGFTTLAALTFKDVFKAGANHFGVSDLERFVGDTHKFEARYLEQLVGKYPEEKEKYQERSPIHNVDRITSPVIIFQGDEDAVVPPSQSELIYTSLVKRNIPTAYLLFKGEQHGFRKAENIQRSFEASLYFFAKVLHIQLSEALEPVDIINSTY